MVCARYYKACQALGMAPHGLVEPYIAHFFRTLCEVIWMCLKAIWRCFKSFWNACKHFVKATKYFAKSLEQIIVAGFWSPFTLTIWLFSITQKWIDTFDNNFVVPLLLLSALLLIVLLCFPSGCFLSAAPVSTASAAAASLASPALDVFITITRRSQCLILNCLMWSSPLFLLISWQWCFGCCWLRRWGAGCYRSGGWDSYGLFFWSSLLILVAVVGFRSLRLPSWLSVRLDAIRLCTHRRMIISRVCSVLFDVGSEQVRTNQWKYAGCSEFRRLL